MNFPPCEPPRLSLSPGAWGLSMPAAVFYETCLSWGSPEADVGVGGSRDGAPRRHGRAGEEGSRAGHCQSTCRSFLGRRGSVLPGTPEHQPSKDEGREAGSLL